MVGEVIIEKIREINLYDDFDRETNLIEEGVLDSMGIFALVNDLEDVFDILIKENDITPENFLCVNTIEILINRLLEGK